jgi:hypothetical protein
MGYRCIVGNDAADQLARLGSDCPLQDTNQHVASQHILLRRRDKERSLKILGALNRTQTCRGFLERTLSLPEDWETAETKQKQFAVGIRLVYRILSPAMASY